MVVDCFNVFKIGDLNLSDTDTSNFYDVSKTLYKWPFRILKY